MSHNGLKGKRDFKIVILNKRLITLVSMGNERSKKDRQISQEKGESLLFTGIANSILDIS